MGTEPSQGREASELQQMISLLKQKEKENQTWMDLTLPSLFPAWPEQCLWHLHVRLQSRPLTIHKSLYAEGTLCLYHVWRSEFCSVMMCLALTVFAYVSIILTHGSRTTYQGSLCFASLLSGFLLTHLQVFTFPSHLVFSIYTSSGWGFFVVVLR